MASLVEELINVLTEEEKVYRTLAANGEKKRQIIIDAFIGCDYDISDLSVLRQLILVGLEIDVLHIRQMPEYSAHL